MATAKTPAAPPPEAKALLVLDKYKNQLDRYNVLSPTMVVMELTSMHRFQVAEIAVNPDPNAGMVYKEFNAGGRLSFLKPTLHNFANAGGIQWHPVFCRAEEVRRDYVRYKAVGMILTPSGTWRSLPPGTKEVWAEDEYDEFKASAEEKVQKGEMTREAAEAWVAKQMRNANQHRLTKAESKAMNRVIRAAMSIRSAYSAADLQKPFLVPHVQFVPDFDDPAVKRIYAVAGAKAATDLFGGQSGGLGGDFTQAELETATRAADHLGGRAGFTGGGAPASGEPVTIDARPARRAEPEDDDNAEEVLPWVADPGLEELSSSCRECGATIQDLTFRRNGEDVTVDALQVATDTKKQFGKELCGTCSIEAHKARKAKRAQGGQGL